MFHISLYNSFLDLLNEHIKEEICYIGAIITSEHRFVFQTKWVLQDDTTLRARTGQYYPYSGYNKLVFVHPFPNRKDIQSLEFLVLKEELPRSIGKWSVLNG